MFIIDIFGHKAFFRAQSKGLQAGQPDIIVISQQAGQINIIAFSQQAGQIQKVSEG